MTNDDALQTVASEGAPPPKADSKPRRKHVLPGGRRVLAEAVEAAPDPYEVAALRMMREQCPTESEGPGLVGGEVATLLRSDLEEPSAIGLCGEPTFPRWPLAVTHTSNIT